MAKQFLPDELVKVVGGDSVAGMIYGDKNTSDPTARFYKDVLSTVNGGHSSSESIKNFLSDDNVKDADIADFAFVKFNATGKESASDSQLSTMLGSITPDSKLNSKTLSAVLVKKAKLMSTVADTRNVSVFMNSLPPTAASQLVPYFEVELEFNYGRNVNLKDLEDNKPPGMLRFLMGKDGINAEGPGTKTLFNSSILSGSNMYSFAGMEMFTSPVTLTNPNPTGRYVQPLNPFAPFASITQADISETITRAGGVTSGIASYRSGRLSITIHDKTRLGEMAEFLKPELFSGNTIWITYGWRMAPGMRQDDPFVEFINNNMIIKEAFVVNNASFNVSGQSVNINLSISTKGFNEISTLSLVDVATGLNATSLRSTTVSGTNDTFERTLIRMKAAVEKLTGNIAANKKAEIFGDKIISGIMNSTFPDIDSVKKEKINAIIGKINNGISSDDRNNLKIEIEQLKKDIEKAYSTSNAGKSFEVQSEYQRNVGANVKKLFDNIKNNAGSYINGKKDDSVGKDPWLGGVEPKQYLIEKTFYSDIGNTAGSYSKSNTRVMSYGALLTSLLGLAGLNNPSITDVQVFFYNLNESVNSSVSTKGYPLSKHGNRMNIAHFPIDFVQLIDDYEKECLSRGGEVLSVSDLIGLMNRQIEDVRGIPYGMRQFFNSKGQIDDNKKGAADTINQWNKSVKLPSIGIKVTTRESTFPTSSPTDALLVSMSAKRRSMGNKNQIMRVEVYDRNDTDAVVDALQAKINNVSGDDEQKVKNLLGMYLPRDSYKLKEVGSVSGQKKYFVMFENSKGVRDLFTRSYPFILPGAEGTAVTSISVETQGVDKNLQASIITRSYLGDQVNSSLAASGPTGLPIRVLPANANMTCLGCPLFQFGQVYYIDFGTGTTLDNTYRVTGITHNFSPGKFTSQLVLSYDNRVDTLSNVLDPIALLDTVKHIVTGG